MSKPRSRRDRDPGQGLLASWERRLQRVGLRTKIVVPIVVLAVAPALLIAVFALLRIHESLEESAAQTITFETASKAAVVEEFLEAVQQDLLFLSRLDAVRALAALGEGGVEGAGARPGGRLREVEASFIVFSQGKRAYYQVRYLNGAGRELVRLEIVGGRPRSVSQPQLQDKSARYYVAAAAALAPGEIYVSALDLNVERGEIELPHRAVVRYATPVAGPDGAGRGLLVINLYADHLFSLIGPLPPAAEAWLVDEQGTYAGYVGASATGREAYALAKARPLATDYSPQELAALQGPGERVATARTAEAIVSRASIRFDGRAPDRTWSLLISQPRAPIDAPIRRATGLLGAGVAVVLVAAAILGVLLAGYVARPIESLRQATREIAGGDLSRRVEITTGDEIEDLAVDFNEMRDRLREAQERLARWNVELEQEVRRRTDELRQLQRNLAQADKLASIGQMTAGVMHEIGNPLAAIKTKIQVAEEGDELDAEARTVLAEILVEVDRLAAFLRSFSRLSRLRAARLAPLSPVELIRSVAALLAPELQRRQIQLRLQPAGDVPPIHGDADQLRQLLINLVLNAADAYSAGGEILVRAARTEPGPGPAGELAQVEIEVLDRGAGMPPEVIDRIWDPFFTTKAAGTGLGLAICRAIVQEHGGTIRARSEKGEGTAIRVTFPGLASATQHEQHRT